MKMSIYENARQMLNDEELSSSRWEENEPFEHHLYNLISSNIYATIGVQMKSGMVLVTAISETGSTLRTFENETEQSYLEVCERLLKIKTSEKYNSSKSLIINGVQTRIYALMPPFVKTPNITISTTKLPPERLSKQSIDDEILNHVLHKNFVIGGASGSGKTYLMNYMLNKFIREDERIAIIEEFGELIAPNRLTSSIIIPPPKPGEESLLRFVTEQSNLMRLDAIYVGEIKSGEAWPFVINLASGTRGGCTVHGDNARQILSRLRALCKMGSPRTDEATIDQFIAKSIDYVIVMKNKNIDSIYELQKTVINGNFALSEFAS